MNNFGLSRSIPENVKREVRIRCGFGCVICGVTITEYEHFFPDFAEAVKHDPDQITLLCPTHHALATKGLLPKENVAASNNSPAARQTGYSELDHPWFTGIPSLKLGGGGLVTGTTIPIQVYGENLLQFEPPEMEGGVSRISASLRDATGAQFLRIIANEWQVVKGDWDFQLIGKRYIFKDKTGIPMLTMRIEAPKFIAIELLRTSVNGIPICITEDQMNIGSNIFKDCTMGYCKVGFSIF